MVLFLAIGGSVFQNIAVKQITAKLPHLSEFVAKNLMAGTSSNAYKSLSVNDKKVVVAQVTSAMSNIWLFFAVAGALSFLLALPLWVRSRDRAFGGQKLISCRKQRLTLKTMR